MVNYKRYTTISNSLICERAALTALAGLPAQRNRYTSLLRRGIGTLHEFSEVFAEKVTLVPPEGTPFAWFDLNTSISSLDLANRLLREYRVLIMPAEVFGGDRGFRLTYARDPAVLVAGIDRLGALLKAVS